MSNQYLNGLQGAYGVSGNTIGGNLSGALGMYQQQVYTWCPTCGTSYPLYGQHLCQNTLTQRGPTMYAGSKPVVICNGQVTECKDLDEAQAKAETLAHQHSADAYILKPVKRVAPKRDVVTTDLP